MGHCVETVTLIKGSSTTRVYSNYGSESKDKEAEQ
jgi:hypothetical protein